MNLLKQIRNIVVHRGGFISNAEQYRDEAPFIEGDTRDNINCSLNTDLSESALSEINVLTNTVYLTDKASGQILTLTKELLNFIVKLDDHLNK